MGISVDGVWERHGIFRTLSGTGAFWVTFIRLFSGGNTISGWWFQIIFYVHPYLGKIPILTNIFQRGWFNHQLDFVWKQLYPTCKETMLKQAHVFFCFAEGKEKLIGRDLALRLVTHLHHLKQRAKAPENRWVLSKNRGTPKWMVKIMENPLKMG